jgi:glycerol kinase
MRAAPAVRILVLDVGTTGVRSAVVSEDGRVLTLHYENSSPTSPGPGLVEFDAVALGDLCLRLARQAIAAAGPVGCVGITNQRASTIAWDARTGLPLGPALGWQDLRTVGHCIEARTRHDIAVAPNQTATKAQWLFQHTDPSAHPFLRISTVESWVANVLSSGSLHVTDHTNAAVTGLYDPRIDGWSSEWCSVFGVDPSSLPSIVPSVGVIGRATALDGAPVISGLIGDQQASLVGQGCIHPGDAKITFGTGAMLDQFRGADAPPSTVRSLHGTFPIIAHSSTHGRQWGTEAIMLAAGTNIEWLCEDMGLVATPQDSDRIASEVPDSGGVMYVPALLGLGTPQWDYGARGTLLGITRGTTAAHIVRAVLEGIAQRGADLLAATEADSGLPVARMRMDGGMSRNRTFVQLFANAVNRPVDVSAMTEATTLGAAFVAGVGAGVWGSLEEATTSNAPMLEVQPTHPLDRDAWTGCLERAAGWIPALSALDF